MSRKENNKNIQAIILAVCCIILLILLIVIFVLGIFFMNKKKTDVKYTEIDTTDKSVEEQTDTKTTTDDSDIIDNYVAVFKVEDSSNMTNVEKTLMIMDARMKSFGLVGESSFADDYISISVGTLDSSQEKYLKYIATPGKFSIVTEDGRKILSEDMIESHEAILETVENDDDVAGELDIKVKDEYVDNFIAASEYAVDKFVSINVDDNTILCFKWTTKMKSGKLVLRCFNKEWLNALDAMLSSGKIHVTLLYVDARSSSLQE